MIRDCPFCTSTHVVVALDESPLEPHHFYTCMNCGARGPVGTTIDVARSKWNARRIRDASDEYFIFEENFR
jgi:Lar family restriction alleviation protein